jgi:hypothetical protein
METFGADDAVAHPHRCVAGRHCYVSPDSAEPGA